MSVQKIVKGTKEKGLKKKKTRVDINETFQGIK